LNDSLQSFFGLNFGQNADIDIILDDQVRFYIILYESCS
jgi:hypothetical protein